MDFELTDDQLELQRVVRDVAARECTPALLRQVVAGDDDASALWKAYVGLDWPSVAIAEDAGGMGFTTVELVLLLEELGRVADPTPMLATTSQYVPLVEACGDTEQRRALLGRVCAGTTGAGAFGPDAVTAEWDGEAWGLRGTAGHVVDGDRADEVAVAATTEEGVAVFVVPQASLTSTRLPSFDATLHVAEITLDGVRVGPERALLAGGAAGVVRAQQVAVAGLAATMVGASQRLLDLALGHVRDRKQFGVPIGSFQAVKHMAVDVYVAVERARALCHFAGLTLAEDDPRQDVAASMAKAAAGECQHIAVRHGVQLFGGLGFTWENDLHLFLRRAKACELLLGTAADHRGMVARSALGALR